MLGSKADAAYFVAILTFNVFAGAIAFLVARYSHPTHAVTFRQNVCVYLVGWLAGSAIVFLAHRVIGLAGVDMPDAFTILLSMAVLFSLMDRLLYWMTESGSLLPRSWRDRFRHS